MWVEGLPGRVTGVPGYGRRSGGFRGGHKACRVCAEEEVLLGVDRPGGSKVGPGWIRTTVSLMIYFNFFTLALFGPEWRLLILEVFNYLFDIDWGGGLFLLWPSSACRRVGRLVTSNYFLF